MDPVPGEMTRELVEEGTVSTVSPERRHWTRPEPRVLHDAAHLRLEKPAEVRLRLQQRAPANLRHHFRRAVVRFLVLVVADLASFGVMRALVRAVRDYALVGDTVAARVEAMVPAGILNGWQYAAALFMGLLVTGNFGRGDKRRDPRRLFLGAALATALPLWMTIWSRGLEPVLFQYGLVTLLVWIGLVLERRTINRVVTLVRPAERDRMDVLFVGPGADCVDAMRKPAFSAGTDYRPIGFLDTHVLSAPGALGRMTDLPTVLAASGAQAVVISGYLSEPQFRDVVDTALAGGCQVLSVPRSIQIAGVHPTTVWRGGQALVELTRPTLKGWQLLLKRLVDLIGASAGLLFLSPLFGLVALAVKVESRGPVSFGHRRVGLNGRTFTCYKFRSMHSDAEERLQADPALHAEYVANAYKLPEGRDPRLTAVGRFLRKTSLDELPQLVNVLNGEMSLVGPRPIVPKELDQYGHGAPVFLSIKPGMTGAWQINGRSHVGYPDRADIELDYVRTWSLMRDLWILFKTLPVVLARRGAH